jgi:hypothetical protein
MRHFWVHSLETHLVSRHESFHKNSVCTPVFHIASTTVRGRVGTLSGDVVPAKFRTDLGLLNEVPHVQVPSHTKSISLHPRNLGGSDAVDDRREGQARRSV